MKHGVLSPKDSENASDLTDAKQARGVCRHALVASSIADGLWLIKPPSSDCS